MSGPDKRQSNRRRQETKLGDVSEKGMNFPSPTCGGEGREGPYEGPVPRGTETWTLGLQGSEWSHSNRQS